MDPKLDELSKITDHSERTTKTFAYLREVGDDWPPLPANITPIAPQTSMGLSYGPSNSGPMGYDNPVATSPLTSQLIELHSLLRNEIVTFLKSTPAEGEFYERLVSKVTAYQTNLGDVASDLSPIMVWKSGNDLRVELKTVSAKQAPSINTPPLDEDRRTALQSLVTLHNAFASLHPEISELDVVGVDPADRHASELTQQVLSGVLEAMNAQVILLMEDVRRDLLDLHTEALTEGKVNRPLFAGGSKVSKDGTYGKK